MATRIDFHGIDGDAAFALVDAVDDRVRLVVSLENDGDYDVILEPAAADALADALVTASRSTS